ncbi:MAG TPA: low-specificity L-threonine aldolase [Thermotogota bacterium]|nr:low-specificity L-threonine aldolase [Thermotogota bacterium]HRW34836.1 low-specificity L-threonine aldolase [Thermotogota bacterium]
MNKIDLRSDTVTHPTQEMLKAAIEAPLGDDVYGDDPTVNRLEALSAKILGKEAALFVPSGTFGNQLSLLTHTLRGDEVILGKHCHIVAHEAGASAVIAGVQLAFFDDGGEYPDAPTIEKMIRTEDLHFPRTGLICVENAHSNGKVIPINQLQSIKKMAESHGIPVHMDGARIFNAAVSLKVTAKEIAACADSVMFCLSKGLCAPVGSMLVGSESFIHRARKNRKIMGGAMRQAGLIGAPGIIALEKMTDRLDQDHQMAQYLAEKLSEIEQVRVLKDQLDINMVYCRISGVSDPMSLVTHFQKNNILVNPEDEGLWRFVTHYWIGSKDIDLFVEKLKEYLSV